AISIALLIVFAFFSVIGEEFGKTISQQSEKDAKAQSIIKELTIAAKQINDVGPRLIDDDTRLDGVSVGPGLRLTYHYTLLNYVTNDSTSKIIKSNFFSLVKERACLNSALKQTMQEGVEFVYSYSDSSGSSVKYLIIDKKKCAPSSI
ncbi:hypothetical protein, partial [Shewanella sp. KT0246]|uniref:hypothetical protein n=1 Tax=Shewanella sp. KT0246 TaxID=2815912 RepID=UPI001C7D4012